MRPYETLIALSHELGDRKKQLVERLEKVITSNGGVLDATHDWGNRRLAYPIKKQGEAHYYLLEYHADGPVVAELERTLRITEGVLRFITVQQEHTGLPQVRAREPRAREHVPLHELRGTTGAKPDEGDVAQATADASTAGDDEELPRTDESASAKEPTDE